MASVTITGMGATPRRNRASRQQLAARERAAYLAHRVGIALRETRVAAGLTQAEVANRAGVSQTEISRLERGRGARSDLEMLAACGAAVGLRLATFFEQAPGASQPRDIEHLRRQSLLVGIAARGGWHAAPESSIPNDGPRPRSIDVLLTRATTREAAVVEIWDLLLDGGEAMRSLDAKVLATRARLGSEWRIEGLFLFRRTSRNRALVKTLAPLIEARFPASSITWLRALSLTGASMPDAAGFAWTSVAGDRLIAARFQ